MQQQTPIVRSPNSIQQFLHNCIAYNGAVELISW